VYITDEKDFALLAPEKPYGKFSLVLHHSDSFNVVLISAHIGRGSKWEIVLYGWHFFGRLFTPISGRLHCGSGGDTFR
jgi:hypothetical protein